MLGDGHMKPPVILRVLEKKEHLGSESDDSGREV